MGQALYRKYRSKSLDEIVGQEHITKTLRTAIDTNRISHAYLFTGPKGVGKTSIARILAHEINQLPYDDNSTHIDIIELDAASNNKVDDIRDLIEKAYISPTSARYKVYIIDEVHMLSTAAFNGLLKTLEEPPAHVIFILATTEVHKLPATIISRTQRFQFQAIDQTKIQDYLRYIAKLEDIAIDDEALELIASHGQGSMRDSIGLLDQAANYAQPITAETISSLIGRPPIKLINQLIEDIANNNSPSLISNLHEALNQGFSAAIIASQLAAIFRTQLINNQLVSSRSKTLDLLFDLINVGISNNPELFLEISLLKTIDLTDRKIESLTVKEVHEKPPLDNTQPVINLVPPNEDKTKAKPSTKDKARTQPQLNKPGDTSLNWDDVLQLLKSNYNTLYGIIRMAQVDQTEPEVVKLKFAYAFHQKRVNEAKNRQIVLDALKQISHRELALECLVDENLLIKVETKDKTEPDLSAISDIFGASEPLS